MGQPEKASVCRTTGSHDNINKPTLKFPSLSALRLFGGQERRRQQQPQRSTSPSVGSHTNKKRRSFSQGRNVLGNLSTQSTFIPHFNFSDELEASSNFVFDNTIHEKNETQQQSQPPQQQQQQQQQQHHRQSPLPRLEPQLPITATEEANDCFDFELPFDYTNTNTLSSLNAAGTSTTTTTTVGSEQREIILYLMRHGEAAHNIKEKEAKSKAKRMSVLEGLPEDHPTTLARMEKARKSVLEDETLRDPPLSSRGRQEAREAHGKLQRLLVEHPEYPRPSYVLVSPLTRTLETCDIVFPDHDEIHVRGDIAERRTLKPPDTRSHVSQLCKRRSFRHFSMEQLRAESMGDIQQQLLERSQHNDNDHTNKEEEPNSKQEVLFIECRDAYDKLKCQDFQWKEEDRAELRRRTERLFLLLGEAQSTSVAVVTHKGYLRELERGPFNQPNATEFTNGEIRIYKITVNLNDMKLIKADRLE